jgi:hypothetical protein
MDPLWKAFRKLYRKKTPSQALRTAINLRKSEWGKIVRRNMSKIICI